MVKSYVPNRGDIVRIDGRPALILSPSAYNGPVGLALLVPITSKVKGYSFEVALPEPLETQGVILSDQIKSFDWRARDAVFEETVPETLMDEVIARIAALLGFN